jgi:L-aspartate oxidase
MTHKDAAFLQRRFPYIFETCLGLEIDIRTDPIPVVPATHYFCGGVDVDTNAHTSVENLLAVGEVSHTGLHGANRLASNSLLEALVYARRAYDGALDGFEPGLKPPSAQGWEEESAGELKEAVILEHDWEEARRVMWDYVGIVRSDQRLTIARERMRTLADTVHRLYWNCRLSQDLLELRNIILVGGLIIESALWRRESRGLHYTETYPQRDDQRYRRDTVLEGWAMGRQP